MRSVVDVIATRAPSRASIRAQANPIPASLPQPVTRAARPERSKGLAFTYGIRSDRRKPWPEPAEARSDDCVGSLAAHRVAADRGDELVALEGQERGIRPGGDGRRARHVAEQRDLAEVVARPERGDDFAVDQHVHIPLVHEVEAVADLALAHDLRAGRCRNTHEAAREMLERGRWQRREERKAEEKLELTLRHDRPLVDLAQPGP